MSFRRIISLPNAFQAFRLPLLNKGYGISGANFSKQILIQSRCLFIKKSAKNVEAEEEMKKQNALFQLNYPSKTKNENRIQLKNDSSSNHYKSLSDVKKRIQSGPLDNLGNKSLLFGMLSIQKEMRKNPDFEEEMQSFIKSEEFEKFAKALEKSLPMLSSNVLFVLFQVMHYYKIPCSSVLLQKLHALILDNINDFRLIQVIQMYLIIRKNEDKLLESLRKAFLMNIAHSYDNLEVTGDIKSMIYFASMKEVPFSAREKFLKKVLSLQSQLKNLEPAMLVRLSLPLCSSEFQFFDKNYFLDALKGTAVQDLDYVNLRILLDNLRSGIFKGPIYYDKNIFNNLALAAGKYNVPQTSVIMNMLIAVGHVSYPLADSLAEKFLVCDRKSLSPAKVREIIMNFGSVDYKNYILKENPNKWKELEKALKDYIDSLQGDAFTRISTVLNLFILGLSSKEIMSKSLTDFSQLLESTNVALNLRRKAFLLYQCYLSLYSTPPEDLPQNFFSDFSFDKEFSNINEWEDMLYKIFNGEEFVLKNCRTPFGTIFSYIAIFGPDKSPINLSRYKNPKGENSEQSDDFIDIKTIETPPGSKVIAFLECGKTAIKFRNLSLLRPIPRIINTIHDSLGYKIFYLFLNKSKVRVSDVIQTLSTKIKEELNLVAEESSKS